MPPPPPLSAQVASICSSFSTNADAWRSVRVLAVTAGAVRCDSKPFPSWIRFSALDPATGLPSQYLPEVAPGYGSCGVSAGGWLQSGGHPQPWNGVVSRSACFQTALATTCASPVNINITNCGGGLILYQLPAAPACGTSATPYGFGFCTTSAFPPSLLSSAPPSPPPPPSPSPNPPPSPSPPAASPPPPQFAQDVLSALPVTAAGIYQWFTGASFGAARPLVWDDASGNGRDGVALGPAQPVRTSQRAGWGARGAIFAYAPSAAAVTFAGEDTHGASASSRPCSAAYVQGGLRAEYFNLSTEAALLATPAAALAFWGTSSFPSPVGRIPVVVRAPLPRLFALGRLLMPGGR